MFVEPTPANARRILRTLEQFGFGTLGLEESDFSKAGAIVQLGRPPGRIDILTKISGVGFAEAWRTRQRGHLAELTVNFLGEAQLRRNKKASGRPKDLLDLALLDELPPKSVTRGRSRKKPK